MKYACLIYIENKKKEFSEEDLAAIAEACDAANAWRMELERTGHFVFCGGLQSVRTAKTVSYRGGTVSVTDGPFSETKEFLGGFTIIEARDFEQAIELVSKFPPTVGKVEVRPLVGPNAELTDPTDRMIAAAIQRRQVSRAERR